MVLRFGTQTDTQPINGGPLGELTPELVASYIAKDATKSRVGGRIGERSECAQPARAGGVPRSLE